MNSAVHFARSDDALSPNLTLPLSLKEQIKLQKLEPSHHPGGLLSSGVSQTHPS